MTLSNVVDGRTALAVTAFLAFGAWAAWGEHQVVAAIFIAMLGLLAYAYLGLRAKVYEAGIEIPDRRGKRRWMAWRQLRSVTLGLGTVRNRPTLLTFRWGGSMAWSIDVTHAGYRGLIGHVLDRLPQRALGDSLRKSKTLLRKDPRLRASRVWELSAVIQILAAAMLALGLAFSMDWWAETGMPAWALFAVCLVAWLTIIGLIETWSDRRFGMGSS